MTNPEETLVDPDPETVATRVLSSSCSMLIEDGVHPLMVMSALASQLDSMIQNIPVEDLQEQYRALYGRFIRTGKSD